MTISPPPVRVLRLGKSLQGCVLPSHADNFELHAPPSTRVHLSLSRRGGDPLLLARYGDLPPVVPRRCRVVADVWDQVSFDSDALEHELQVQMPGNAKDKVQVAVHNYSAHLRTPCHYTISAVRCHDDSESAFIQGGDAPRVPISMAPFGAGPMPSGLCAHENWSAMSHPTPLRSDGSTHLQSSAPADGAHASLRSDRRVSFEFQGRPSRKSVSKDKAIVSFSSPTSPAAVSGRSGIVVVYTSWRKQRLLWRCFSAWLRLTLRGSRQHSPAAAAAQDTIRKRAEQAEAVADAAEMHARALRSQVKMLEAAQAHDRREIESLRRQLAATQGKQFEAHPNFSAGAHSTTGTPSARCSPCAASFMEAVQHELSLLEDLSASFSSKIGRHASPTALQTAAPTKSPSAVSFLTTPGTAEPPMKSVADLHVDDRSYFSMNDSGNSPAVFPSVPPAIFTPTSATTSAGKSASCSSVSEASSFSNLLSPLSPTPSEPAAASPCGLWGSQRDGLNFGRTSTETRKPNSTDWHGDEGAESSGAPGHDQKANARAATMDDAPAPCHSKAPHAAEACAYARGAARETTASCAKVTRRSPTRQGRLQKERSRCDGARACAPAASPTQTNAHPQGKSRLHPPSPPRAQTAVHAATRHDGSSAAAPPGGRQPADACAACNLRRYDSFPTHYDALSLAHTTTAPVTPAVRCACVRYCAPVLAGSP
uniref:Uncharacterized protein n=3 Tax=Chrysotila carterae TaxID=13221 RepID=A0A7S4EY22_CHRCT